MQTKYHSTQGRKVPGWLVVVLKGRDIVRSKFDLYPNLVHLVSRDGRPLQTRSHFSRPQNYTGNS